MTPLLHAIGNAHIDPVWLWRWPEGLETVRATFQSVLDRMDEYPEFVFSGSSAALYAWLLETDPELFNRIKARVAEGRWEIVGGWWIQPDANIPCGESLVRQALYGQRFFQAAFGVMATVGYNPDTFGHTGTLPQILSKAGLTRYIFMRPGPHEKTLPGNVFWWESPDGSRVLTARIPGSYGTWGDALREQVNISHAARPPYVADFIVFYGVGNHGGGPTRANIESIQAMSRDQHTPPVALSSLDAFFSAVESDLADGAQVPVVADDLQHHARGCYLAESEVKRQNRRVEHALMSAERLASAAWLALGRPYPQAELTEAWKSVLFNQFHDILAGSSLPAAYQDARDWYGHAATLADRALNMAMQILSSRIDTRGPGDALVIFNPLPWDVKVPVEVERGSASLTNAGGKPVAAQGIQPATVVGQRRSCFVAELPALGYRVFRQDVAASADNPLFKATEASGRGTTAEMAPSLVFRDASMAGLENAYWRLEVDSVSGHLTRLFDKRNRVEVLAGPANVGVVIDDHSDTWSHEVPAFRDEVGRFGEARISVDEDGPVRAMLRIETRWGQSTLVQHVGLYRELDIIECRAAVNWQAQHKLLKLAFPFRLDEPKATYDIAYGRIERACNGEEESGQQWVDIGGWATSETGERMPYGVGVLNDSKYSFDALGAELRMGVLRSPVYAHHDPFKLDPQRSYVYQDQGWQSVAVRLVPHRDAWPEAALSRRAWELNVPPAWVNEYAHNGPLPVSASFLSAQPANIVLAVCKMAEDGGDLIVRGYESAGRATQAVLRLPHLGITWQSHFAAHEIKSWRLRPHAPGEPVAEEVDLLERIV